MTAATSPAGPRDLARRWRLALAALAVLAAGQVVVLRSVAEPVGIASGSMEPTLYRGDVVLVDRRPLHAADLRRGDLVTFTGPQDGAETLKRVVGLPGEAVALRDAVLVVDEVPVDEPYLDRRLDAEYTATVTVPPAHLVLFGDNRDRSVDSRDHGPVPLADVTGRVLVRLWPPVRLGADDPQPGGPDTDR